MLHANISAHETNASFTPSFVDWLFVVSFDISTGFTTAQNTDLFVVHKSQTTTTTTTMRFIQAISNVAGEKLRSAGCWARSKILRSRRSKKIEETNSAIVIVRFVYLWCFPVMCIQMADTGMQGAPTDVRREEYTLETDAAG
jgi:hypothetical protein